MKRLFILLIVPALLLCSCAKDEFFDRAPESFGDFMKGESAESGDVPDVDPETGHNTSAGVVTAGEWCDLDNWCFWSGLMTGEDFSKFSGHWGYYTDNRVDVNVKDLGGKPVAGIPVDLVWRENGNVIWSSVTDNRGDAQLWAGLFQSSGELDPETLALKVDGRIQESPVCVASWDLQQEPGVNCFEIDAFSPVAKAVEISFIVDATGSMSDEMEFLKQDLQDIIGKVSRFDGSYGIRTSAVFYRDEGDEYLTRVSDFTDKLSATHDFIKAQKASGGGDYPEAVHTALEVSLQNLSWKEDAACKLAFMLLDAPAHNRDDVKASLQQSVKTYAKNGIRLIPIAASGVNKSTEFMLRFFAIATGGTYVFITNDSGVGNDHIAASVGEYKVEQLNDLIVRLIQSYMAEE